MSMESKEKVKQKRGLLERLRGGEVIIGDGGLTMELEKRGYVQGGIWTPECTVEHPEAVRQLHREFARAGSDVLQAFIYRSGNDKIALEDGSFIQCDAINQAACDIVKQVASESNLLVCGGISSSYKYKPGCDKEEIRRHFREQADALIKAEVDFLLGEQMDYLEEAELCLDELKKSGLPVAITLCIGPQGDHMGKTLQECAVRLAQGGADILGLNCRFDPATRLKCIRKMKEGLEEAGLLSKVFLMLQPVGYVAPSAEKYTYGYVELPEWPFALDQRTLTRFEAKKFAREAYDLGVRYIGGCCGFQPHHIRAMAEELAVEKGKLPAGSKNSAIWGDSLKTHFHSRVAKRTGREYWENVPMCCGREKCSSYQL